MDERGPALAAELLDLLTAAVSGLFPGPVLEALIERLEAAE